MPAPFKLRNPKDPKAKPRGDGAGATGPEVLAALDALVTSRPEMLLSDEALSAIEARALNRPVRESRLLAY